MSIPYEKLGKVLATVIHRKPAVAIVLSVIASFTFLMWKQPSLQSFFLELFNAQTIPLFGLILVMSLMYLTNATRIHILESEVIKHELETDICRLEQTLIRQAMFNTMMVSAHTDQDKDLVIKILKKLDEDLQLVPEKAKVLFQIRSGGPQSGGQRHDDPNEDG